MQIVSKNIEIEKEIKIIPMNKLRGSFPDFDSGEDAWEDYNDSLHSSY